LARSFGESAWFRSLTIEYDEVLTLFSLPGFIVILNDRIGFSMIVSDFWLYSNG
jgi:hypothetical protein